MRAFIYCSTLILFLARCSDTHLLPPNDESTENKTASTGASTSTSSSTGGSTSTSSSTGASTSTSSSTGGSTSTSSSTGGSTSTSSSTGGSTSTSSSTGGSSTGGSTGITGLNGSTYYVAPTGSDANAGTQTKPWQTIQQAGAVVTAGDTVIVKAGTYDGPIFGWDSPTPGDPEQVIAGTSAHPILFEADPEATAGTVIIAGKNAENKSGFDLEPGCDDIDIVGFTVTNAGTAKNPAGSITKAGIAVGGCTGCQIVGNTVDDVTGIGGILVDGVTSVTIQGNTVTNTQGTGTTGHGMYISGSSTKVSVLNNLIHDNAYVGIHVNGDESEGLPGVVTDITIAGNVIYKNGQNGINCDGIESSLFENNVIYGNARNGIELYQIDAFGGSTNNVIVNNSIDQSSSGYAIETSECDYDNDGSPPNCPGDSSTGNIVFNNVLLGKSGATNAYKSDDLLTSNNITSATPSPFVDSASGNYTLAPSGPGPGKGVASYDSAVSPEDGSVYDIGAFSFGL